MTVYVVLVDFEGGGPPSWHIDSIWSTRARADDRAAKAINKDTTVTSVEIEEREIDSALVGPSWLTPKDAP